MPSEGTLRFENKNIYINEYKERWIKFSNVIGTIIHNFFVGERNIFVSSKFKTNCTTKKKKNFGEKLNFSVKISWTGEQIIK